MTSGAQRAAYAGLLRNRNYRLWFGGAVSSSVGDWAGLFALQILVASLAESGSRLQLFSLGGIMMARLLPSLLIGPAAGVLADRYNRKHLMVFADIVRGLLFVAIAFSGDLVAVFALTFVVECLSLLFLSAKDAVLPALVDRRHLTEANQLNLLVTYGTLPFGAALGAAMIGVARLVSGVLPPALDPITLVLLLDAVTFLIAAALNSRMRFASRAIRPEREESAGVVAELREGLRFIRDLPLIRSLILGVVGISFGAGVIVALGPAFVSGTLGRLETDWNTLITAVGVGLMLGIVVVRLLTRRFAKERLFPIGLIATAAVAVWIATTSSFVLTLGLGFLLGGVAGASFVLGYTLLHEYTQDRDEVRAKTFAAFYTGTRMSMFAALGLGPFFAGFIGRGTLIIGGSVITMSGVRITILLGGLIGLASAVVSGRAMFRASAAREPGVRLPGVSQAGTGGVFIALEGVEGSGKSTQVKALVATLSEEGYDVVVTREPGGPPVAERIRHVLLDPNAADMDARTEALLHAAARAEHVTQVIRPALESGKVVICDRYLDSSLAYQGHARQLGEDDVAEINRWATGGLVPDAVVLLHLDPEEGMRRVTERVRRTARRTGRGKSSIGPIGDRMEREDLDFHRRVGRGYLELAKRHRHRFVVIDADADAGTVARQVRSGLHAWLPLAGEDERESARRGSRRSRADADRPEAAG